jgi:hypothetical protein
MQSPESAIATRTPAGRILINVEWTARAVWWTMAVVVFVIAILIVDEECRRRAVPARFQSSTFLH